MLTYSQRKIIKDNKNVKEFIDSGNSTQAAKYLSAAYLLISLGNFFLDETLDLFEKYDLLYGKLKTKACNFENVFDNLEKEIGKYIQKEASDKLVKDYEDLEKYIKQLFDIDYNNINK